MLWSDSSLSNVARTHPAHDRRRCRRPAELRLIRLGPMQIDGRQPDAGQGLAARSAETLGRDFLIETASRSYRRHHLPFPVISGTGLDARRPARKCRRRVSAAKEGPNRSVGSIILFSTWNIYPSYPRTAARAHDLSFAIIKLRLSSLSAAATHRPQRSSLTYFTAFDALAR